MGFVGIKKQEGFVLYFVAAYCIVKGDGVSCADCLSGVGSGLW